MGWCRSTSSDGTEYLELNERQTKTRTGENIAYVRRVPPKMFATGCRRWPVKLYKEYADRRPEGFSRPEDPFYLAPHTKFDSLGGQWFVRQRVGLSKLGKMLKAMPVSANLPGDRSPTEIMSVTGHKNVQSILNYSTVTVEQQKKCSHLLSGPSPSSRSHASPFTSSNPHASATITSSCDSHAFAGQETNVLPRHVPETAASDVTCPSEHHQHAYFSQQNVQNQLSNTLKSQFYGAHFHIQNFHIHNWKISTYCLRSFCSMCYLHFLSHKWRRTVDCVLNLLIVSIIQT